MAQRPDIILNVDDDAANRYAVTRILQREGFEVREAATGAEALRLARELPDLVILDVKLPDIDGREVARRLREDPHTANLAILQLSAHAVRSEERAEGLERGADVYLTQPVASRELVAAVRSLLRIRRAEEEAVRRADALAEADRRKDEFLAMLGHELRNPLAALSAALEIAEPGSELDVRVHDIMKRQLHHLARLVDDLLEVSRITRGKIELRRERMDLRLPLKGALQAATTEFERRGHQVEVSVPDEPVEVEVDATRMQQVMANLLDNAAKYTEPGGKVAVRLGIEDGRASVRVRDTGVGIPPERLEHIFDLFVQVDPTLDRTRGGMGIGLTLVKQLVQMHGGDVEAMSTPGQGSEFVVRVPLARRRRRLERSQGQAATAAADRALRVLVIEDNDDMREMLVFALRRRGHEVLEAADGPGGLESVLRERPDVALVDVGLPGMDGYELARRVRAEADGAPVYMVALTGYGRASDRSESRAAGFDLHLVKPVGIQDIEEVLARVRTRGNTAAS